MKYSSHIITKNGSIIVREVDAEGRFHRYTISPSDPVEKYTAEIESDPNFALYRTTENADAHEQAKQEWIEENEISEEEALNRKRQSMYLERGDFMAGLALYSHEGTLLKELVENCISQLPEPKKMIVQTFYDEKTSFLRLHPLVVEMSAEIGMTPEETDDFFVWVKEQDWNN